MNTKIKICGLRREEDILCANEIQPDFIGFVFAKKSRRFVSPEQAAHLRELLSPKIISVGVFVNEEPGQAARLLEQGVIGMAQLHGQEDEAYMKELRKHCSQPVIKAFIIKTKEDMEKASSQSHKYYHPMLFDHLHLLPVLIIDQAMM